MVGQEQPVYSWGDVAAENNANWDHGNDANKTEDSQHNLTHGAFMICMEMCMNGRWMPFSIHNSSCV